MKKLTALFLLLALASTASAFDLEANLRDLGAGLEQAIPDGMDAAQSNGKSLSEAVESIRRRGNVERIVSAQTRVENGREVHHIRYMTKDGKVRTAKVNGRRRR